MTHYLHRHCSLATKHGKARAIARPFRCAVGLQMVLPELDTDLLGTFSGEVQRQGSALETCLRKARLGMEATGLPLGIANEGSFGPHPFIGLIPSGVEVMTFVDDERNLVVTETLVTERTNYGHREAHAVDDLFDWLPYVGFPSHALIVRTKLDGPGLPVEKGIVSIERLKEVIAIAVARSDEGIAWVEPDMRAHLNPTRMSTIRQLAFRLARRLAAECPACSSPGWGRIGVVEGLPCEICDEPTNTILADLFGCPACDHREEKPRRNNPAKASARYCPQCNP